MSSGSSGADTPGTLVVGVPHWATTVRLFDNLYQAVATLSSPTDVGEGRFQVTMTLAPGVYKVEVALGASDDSEWVSVRPGKQTTIPADRWANLHLASAAPLQSIPQGRPTEPGTHATKAQEWSKSITWPSPQPGPARLFIFMHTPDAKTYPDFSQGLTLLDGNGHTLTALAGASIEIDATAGWLAFTTDLPGGFYILARNGPGPSIYNLPLYLCDDWETQVFMTGGRGPSFRSLTMNMAPGGDGFRYDDETAAASEAVLTGLRREGGMAAVLASSHLSLLLRREQKNPWLAVLAGYALSAAEAEAQRLNADQTSTGLGDPTLKHDVIQFLRATIGSHPDVRALCLEPNVPAQQPFEFPPLMRIGLQRVQRHATKFADTIPIGSLTDKLLNRQVTSSSWSVWRQPAASARQAAQSDAAPSNKKRPRRRVATSVLRAGLGSSAPVFQAPIASRTSGTGAEDLRRALYDLPLIKAAAKQMIGSIVGATPEKIVVNAKEEVSKLLSQINSQAFSAAAGIPLGRAERVLGRMCSASEANPGQAGGGPTERAILEYALRQGARGSRLRRAPMAQAKEALKPNPKDASDVTLEESVSALWDAAEQLLPSGARLQPDPVVDARAEALAQRLRGIAEALLRHADFVAITDANGELLYGNGAFTLLMSLNDKANPQRTCRTWSRWLSTLPVGRSSHQTPDVDSADRRWTVRRIAVEDQETARTTAYVNILDDERVSRLTAPVFAHVRAAVPDITLHASFIQYASPKRRADSLDRLEKIVEGLDQSLSLPGEPKRS